MDSRTELTLSARKIARALMNYANDRGWGPDDYKVYARLNPDWGRIHVVFAARGFERTDNFEDYKNVLNYLKTVFEEDPDLANSISLVIRDFNSIRDPGILGIGWEFMEVNAGS